MAVTWVTRTDISPGATGAFTDVDLDSFFGSLPADVSMVLLEVYNNSGGTEAMGARKNGSTDNRTDILRHHGLQGMWVGVDADNILELYKASVATEFYAVAYAQDADAEFLTNGIQKSVSSGSYQDIDVSADFTGIAIAVCLEWQGGVAYGHRTNGSTDNRVVISQSHLHTMAGCDVDEITEVFRTSGGVNPFLMGAFLQDLTINTNAPDRSLGDVDIWTNITSGGGDGALVEIISSATDYGLRLDGSAVTVIGHPGGDSHAFHAVETLSSVYEGNITNTNVDFFEILTFDAAAVVGGPPVGSLSLLGVGI